MQKNLTGSLKVTKMVTAGGGVQPVKFAPFFLNLYVNVFLVTEMVTDV